MVRKTVKIERRPITLGGGSDTTLCRGSLWTLKLTNSVVQFPGELFDVPRSSAEKSIVLRKLNNYIDIFFLKKDWAPLVNDDRSCYHHIIVVIPRGAHGVITIQHKYTSRYENIQETVIIIITYARSGEVESRDITRGVGRAVKRLNVFSAPTDRDQFVKDVFI